MKFYQIEGLVSGRLAVAARPRGGDWLSMDLDKAKRGGWTVLVSALERGEEVELDLASERRFAANAGLDFVSFPIADRTAPNLRPMLDLVKQLRGYLTNGGSVAVHCRMGIGRSGLMCASTLVAFGEAPANAWARVRAARGMRVPDTDEQLRWLSEFASAWPTSS